MTYDDIDAAIVIVFMFAAMFVQGLIGCGFPFMVAVKALAVAVEAWMIITIIITGIIHVTDLHITITIKAIDLLKGN